MCRFYCWESLQNICCISKKILIAIIWFFVIRFIFDLIFVGLFGYFECYLYFTITLVVGILLIYAVVSQRLKIHFLYVIFEAFSILLLLVDIGVLAYIIYSVIAAEGSLYHYTKRNVEKKSRDSLFTADNRVYRATDIILFTFGIFMLFSCVHDFINLYMINRAMKYLKRKNTKKTTNGHISSTRYVPPSPRPRVDTNCSSLPSNIAPQPPDRYEVSRISMSTIAEASPTSPMQPIPSSERTSSMIPVQSPRAIPSSPEVLTNLNYSYTESFPPRVARIETPVIEYETPPRRPDTLPIAYPEDNIIRTEDNGNPFNPSEAKDKKKESKSEIPLFNDALQFVPPIPAKRKVTAQISESSFNYENISAGLHETASQLSVPHSQCQLPSYSSSITISTLPVSHSHDDFKHTVIPSIDEHPGEEIFEMYPVEANVDNELAENFSDHSDPEIEAVMGYEVPSIPEEKEDVDYDSEDYVAFWTNNRSTRRRRRKGSSESNDDYLSNGSKAATTVPVVSKNAGLLKMLEMEQKDQINHSGGAIYENIPESWPSVRSRATTEGSIEVRDTRTVSELVAIHMVNYIEENVDEESNFEENIGNEATVLSENAVVSDYKFTEHFIQPIAVEHTHIAVPEEIEVETVHETTASSNSEGSDSMMNFTSSENEEMDDEAFEASVEALKERLTQHLAERVPRQSEFSVKDIRRHSSQREERESSNSTPNDRHIL